MDDPIIIRVKAHFQEDEPIEIYVKYVDGWANFQSLVRRFQKFVTMEEQRGWVDPSPKA